MATDMEKGHASVRRGVSWSPGESRKPLQLTQDMRTPGTDCDASWEKTGFNKEHMSRKTSKCLFICHFLSLFGEAKQRRQRVLLLRDIITQKCGCKYNFQRLACHAVLILHCGLHYSVSLSRKKSMAGKGRQHKEKIGSLDSSLQPDTVKRSVKHLFP